MTTVPLLTSIPYTSVLPEQTTQPSASGTRQLSDALRPGHELMQKGLGDLAASIDHFRLNLSEGERSALQQHVSQFGALVTLAMNVSMGIGKAYEKLQQG